MWVLVGLEAGRGSTRNAGVRCGSCSRHANQRSGRPASGQQPEAPAERTGPHLASAAAVQDWLRAAISSAVSLPPETVPGRKSTAAAMTALAGV